MEDLTFSREENRKDFMMICGLVKGQAMMGNLPKKILHSRIRKVIITVE